ncbi:MAG TPA: DNA internalization-related competence protein ComEC/Rec2 [Vicinamibacteria bacterium]|nr:DNA internalization-related competence protein ComEC/Rec2 [Vicinamibacteria bacterium]
MSRPLLSLALAYGLGSFCGDVGPRAALCLLALAAMALGLAWAAPARQAAWALVAGALALGAAGAALEAAAYDKAPLGRWFREAATADEGPVRLRGVAVVPVPADGERHPLILDVEGVGLREPLASVAGRVRVEIGGDAGAFDIREGDRLELQAALAPPRPLRSPGAFDAEAWARREGLHALGFCKSPLLVRRLSGCGGRALPCLVSPAREWARASLRRHVLPGQQQALVRAMVLGDRSGLDEATAEAFRRAGTYHVLALSGAQVALVAGLLVALGRRAELAPLPLGLAVSMVLAGYALLVGGDVPVVRATVMAIVVVMGRGLDLDADLSNLLGLAAILLLAWRPSSVGDAGFQLAFGATLAIVLLAPRLARGLARLPLGAGALIAGSVAAQAVLLPILALDFHRLSPVALLLNLAAVPLSGAVLLLGALVLPLGALASRLGDVSGDLAWMAADTLLRTCNGGGLAAAADVRSPDPTLLVLVPWALGLRALYRGRWVEGLAFVSLTLGALALGPGPRADGRLELAVLDVGQGDALVLRSPSGRAIAVDAGPAREGFDLGERIVAPFLWSEGVRRLDRLVLTHAHPDHAGGVPFLLRAFGPAEVWEGVAPVRDQGYETFADALRENGATRLAVARGRRVVWDGVTLEVLGPAPPPKRPLRTRNDDSLVLSVTFGEVTFLLTGDVEGAGERALTLPPSVVLKVPHHGSRTSTTEGLLQQARPRWAVVSAGFRNHFGHPHPDVLRRLGALGVRVFRTDRDGTVRLRTDGTHIWVAMGAAGAEERMP